MMNHKPPHCLFRRPFRFKNLDSFYEWCKRIGHYHAYETVERYRRIK
jgi:hypothetical protein